MRLVDRLNTPVVLVLVLGFVVAVNGLLLYRYASIPGASDPAPLAVQDEEITTVAPTTIAPEPTTTEETTAEETTTAAPRRPPESEPESSGPGPPESETPGPADDAAPPPAYTPPTLADAIAGCETAEEECVAAYVAGIAPEAEYVEEVPDANSLPSEANRLFYFRNPDLAPCAYSWENYTFGDSVYYSVIIYGAGSFDESGQGCILAF